MNASRSRKKVTVALKVQNETIMPGAPRKQEMKKKNKKRKRNKKNNKKTRTTIRIRTLR